jgi:predicted GIY-YIG superfamily endonuclease
MEPISNEEEKAKASGVDTPPDAIDDFRDISREGLAALSKEKTSEWLVYILRSVPRPMRTYAGVTNNILRRIRQHNGEISGGACATKTTRPWELYAIVHGFGEDKRRALRCEWFTKVKHYKSSLSGPGSSGVTRRRFLIKYAMEKCREGPKLCARALALEEPPQPKQTLPPPGSKKLVIVSDPAEIPIPVKPPLVVVPELSPSALS